MALIAEWKIEGQNNQTYTFDVYTIDSTLPDSGGVYILSLREQKEDGGGIHKVLYIGKAQSIANRVSKVHEKWDMAIRMGMNAISIYPDIDESLDNLDKIRSIIEDDLISKFEPPLNK